MTEIEDVIAEARRIVEADRLTGKVTNQNLIAFALGLGSWVDAKITRACNCACACKVEKS